MTEEHRHINLLLIFWNVFNSLFKLLFTLGKPWKLTYFCKLHTMYNFPSSEAVRTLTVEITSDLKSARKIFLNQMKFSRMKKMSTELEIKLFLSLWPRAYIRLLFFFVFVFCFSFFFIITWSGRQAKIRGSVCISKSQEMLCVLFSLTDFEVYT